MTSILEMYAADILRSGPGASGDTDRLNGIDMKACLSRQAARCGERDGRSAGALRSSSFNAAQAITDVSAGRG